LFQLRLIERLIAAMSAGILPALMFAGFQPACAGQGITAGPPARCRRKRMPLWRAALIIHFPYLSLFSERLESDNERRHFAGINVRRLSAGLRRAGAL
jgi:hypothetical protein